jgi:hypothetical protein
LHNHAQDADKTEEITVLVRVVTEALFGEESEESRHNCETGDREEIGRYDRGKHPAMTMTENFADARVFVRLGAVFAR